MDEPHRLPAGYSSAPTKAAAVARMYFLGNCVPEPIGRGSKEKKSALVALGRFHGIDLSHVPRKTECGRIIAELLETPWDDSCHSRGDTITLAGLNRLIDTTVAVYLASGARPRRAFLRDIMNIKPAPQWEDSMKGLDMQSIEDIEAGIGELLRQLSESGACPVGVHVRSELLEGKMAGDLTQGRWRTPLIELQGWLHLADEIEADDVDIFDCSLAKLLGVENAENVPQDEFLALLHARIELAVQYRAEFLEELEEETEGSATLKTASSHWEEKWDTLAEAEQESTSEPIDAKADTWPIINFCEYANENRLKLSPSYQRADVWATSDSQLLIESILRGIPLPSVILLNNNNHEGDHYEIVDGKQRLTSILRFTGSHPNALENVRRKAEEWGVDEEELVDEFRDDYPAFQKRWKAHEESILNETLARELHFPFRLKGVESTLSGELAKLRKKYYSEIRKVLIPLGKEHKRVSDLFNKSSVSYQIPVIVYNATNPRQIHEVFSLYNRQGKRLNAEEIRNAVFHELDFMKALLATAGDTSEPLAVAPFLKESWDDLSSTGAALKDKETGYGLPDAGYKRTKLLSWIASILLYEDEALGKRSTANHINGLLTRIQDGKNDPLRARKTIRDVMRALDAGIDAHQEIPAAAWAPEFRNAGDSARWQELQLVAVLAALTVCCIVRGVNCVDELYERSDSIARVSKMWRRPQKTQSKQQWQFIAGVVRELLELMEIDGTQANSVIVDRFGSSGIRPLMRLPRPEWWSVA